MGSKAPTPPPRGGKPPPPLAPPPKNQLGCGGQCNCLGRPVPESVEVKHAVEMGKLLMELLEVRKKHKELREVVGNLLEYNPDGRLNIDTGHFECVFCDRPLEYPKPHANDCPWKKLEDLIND